MSLLVHRIKKYLRIYKYYFKNSILILLAHKFNLLMSAVANLVWTFLQIVTLHLLFDKIPKVQDYAFSDLVLLLAFTQCFVYTTYIFYDVNLDKFANKLREGDFDRMLLKPINVKFQASFEQVAIAQIFSMLITVFPLLYIGFSTQENLNIFNSIIAFLVLILGIVILFFFRLSIAGLNFFFEETQSLKATVLDSARELVRVPLDLFPKIFTYIFTFFIPLAFISFFPMQIVRSGFKKEIILAIEFLILLIVIVLSKIIWDKGLKRFEGVN